MPFDTRNASRYPGYARLNATPSRQLPADLQHQEHEAAFHERRDAIQALLLDPLHRPPEDVPLFTTIWQTPTAFVTMTLPEGGLGLPVFSSPIRAVDYQTVQLNAATPNRFMLSTAAQLFEMLLGIRRLSIADLALDRCPRCQVFTAFACESVKAPSDLIAVWALAKAFQGARLELYLHYAGEAIRSGRLDVAREVLLETVGHVTPEDPRPHMLLGHLALRLGDAVLLREAQAFLRFLHRDEDAQRLEQGGLTPDNTAAPGADRVADSFGAAVTGADRPSATDGDRRSAATHTATTRTDPSPPPLPDGAHPDMFVPGDLIDRAFRVKHVRRGGMGVVYIVEFEPPRAEDPHRDDYVSRLTGAPADDFAGRSRGRQWFALKVAGHQRPLPRRDAVQRFERECVVWATLLPHPNVVRAFMADRIGGLTPFVLLEYVGGGNLRDKINAGLTLDAALSIALGVCRGMRFLDESERIVHRDIKPENILVTKDGVPKVTDFGLVVITPSTGHRSETTPDARRAHLDDIAAPDGRVAGSLPYMSPEQLTGGQVDTRSDVYSFGVVLYEMLTGRRPFDAVSFSAHRRTHLYESPVAPADAPADVGAIVVKCLAKNPSDRFQNFAELAEQIVAFCHRNGLDEIVPPPLSIASLEESMTPADWVGRGRSLFTLGTTLASRHRDGNGHTYLEQACACLYKACSSGWRAESLGSTLGPACSLLGRHDEAIPHFRADISSSPESFESYVGLARSLESVGRVDEALAMLQDAAERYPGAFTLRSELAMIYARQKHQPESRDAIGQAFRSRPEPRAEPPNLVARWWRKYIQRADRPDNAFALDGWSEAPGEGNMRVWRNAFGDALTLHDLGHSLSLPLFSNKAEIQTFCRELAESLSSGLVELNTVLRQDVGGLAFIYKRFDGPTFVFTGMLGFDNGDGTHFWTVMAGDKGPEAGKREAVVASELLNSGTLTPEQYEREWARDPYDPDYAAVPRMALRCMADDESFDARFPDHPLSRIRRTLAQLPYPGTIG
jgi:serine/threonine protein kinase